MKVLDLVEFRRKKDPLIIMVGDEIEWIDYDLRLYQGIVHAIKNSRQQDCRWIHLKNPATFEIFLEQGLILVSTSVTRKIVPEKPLVAHKLRFPTFKRKTSVK